MKPAHTLWCLLLILAGLFTSSQKPDAFFRSSHTAFSSDRTFFRLGDNVLSITKMAQPEEKKFVLVSLHNNETTALLAAEQFIRENGGQLVRLDNDEKHNIEFEFLTRSYSIDPNKIFTQKGRANILRHGPYKNTLSVEVQRFADYLLEIIPNNRHIAGIHNVKKGERTVKTYKNKKNIRRIKAAHVEPSRDEHDFFVTTDNDVFQKLKEKKFNVILQHQALVLDDGSLSIAVSRNRKVYVDIIAQHGHGEEQKEMIEALAEIFEARD